MDRPTDEEAEAAIGRVPRMIIEPRKLRKSWRPVKKSKYRPAVYCEVHSRPRWDAQEARAYMDTYAVENRFQLLMTEAEKRARKLGVPYDISAKERAKLWDRFDAGLCELSGVPFMPFQLGGVQRQPFAASLDRIDPKNGYVYDNCRWILQGLNYLRSDMTDSDFKRVVVLFVANSREMLDEVHEEVTLNREK